MNSFNAIFLSLLGGILPALIWLWFWLKEDKLHPEPRLRIALSFVCGMVAVWPAIELERHFCGWLDPTVCSAKITPGPLLILIWATIEELFKYILAYFTALKTKVTDEPIDSVIYMITAALGFSGLENTLFIFNLVGSGNLLQSFMTSNSRFLGASLLHIASSAVIGVMLGLAYYKRPNIKRIFLLTGLAGAVLLHTVFNLLIIKQGDGLFFIFAGVWVLIVLLIVLLEKVKKTHS